MWMLFNIRGKGFLERASVTRRNALFIDTHHDAFGGMVREKIDAGGYDASESQMS